MKPHLPITFLIALLGCFVVNAVEYNGLDNLSFVSQSSSTNGGAISDSNIDITGINDYDSSIIDVYFYGNRADASQTISGD